MFGFDPGFSIDSELPVCCLERKKGVVVSACRFWPIARGSHDHERESAGCIVGHDKSGIRRKTVASVRTSTPSRARRFAALRANVSSKVGKIRLPASTQRRGPQAPHHSRCPPRCVANDLLLILDTAMERLVFDARPAIHPAALPGMASRTITVGSSAKELRMIGWRVGWIVGPEEFMLDIVAVSLANVVVPVGIAQDAVATALENSYASIGGYYHRAVVRR